MPKKDGKKLLVGHSQGGQDRRLSAIIASIGVVHQKFVEFGYTGTSTSNTLQLRRQGWSGLLLDGKNSDESINLHAKHITSRNIVGLFREHEVPVDVDYVSIDIDSFDLFVLRALLASEYRPRVLTVEYNSNFPWGFDLAFPDPEVEDVPQNLRHWGGNCYMGSSASALARVARRWGYVVADVEPGLDLFLVRAELWRHRPRPDLATLPTLYRPFNVQMDGAMSARQRDAYVDYRVWEETGGNVSAARAAARKSMAALRRRGVPCLAGHRSGCLLQKCDLLYSFLCVERDATAPCERYGVRGSWYAPQGCWGPRCNFSRYPGGECAGKLSCPLLDDPASIP